MQCTVCRRQAAIRPSLAVLHAHIPAGCLHSYVQYVRLPFIISLTPSLNSGNRCLNLTRERARRVAETRRSAKRCDDDDIFFLTRLVSSLFANGFALTQFFFVVAEDISVTY